MSDPNWQQLVSRSEGEGWQGHRPFPGLDRDASEIGYEREPSPSTLGEAVPGELEVHGYEGPAPARYDPAAVVPLTKHARTRFYFRSYTPGHSYVAAIYRHEHIAFADVGDHQIQRDPRGAASGIRTAIEADVRGLRLECVPLPALGHPRWQCHLTGRNDERVSGGTTQEHKADR